MQNPISHSSSAKVNALYYLLFKKDFGGDAIFANQEEFYDMFQSVNKATMSSKAFGSYITKSKENLKTVSPNHQEMILKTIKEQLNNKALYKDAERDFQNYLDTQFILVEEKALAEKQDPETPKAPKKKTQPTAKIPEEWNAIAKFLFYTPIGQKKMPLFSGPDELLILIRSSLPRYKPQEIVCSFSDFITDTHNAIRPVPTIELVEAICAAICLKTVSVHKVLPTHIAERFKKTVAQHKRGQARKEIAKMKEAALKITKQNGIKRESLSINNLPRLMASEPVRSNNELKLAIYCLMTSGRNPS